MYVLTGNALILILPDLSLGKVLFIIAVTKTTPTIYQTVRYNFTTVRSFVSRVKHGYSQIYLKK